MILLSLKKKRKTFKIKEINDKLKRNKKNVKKYLEILSNLKIKKIENKKKRILYRLDLKKYDNLRKSIIDNEL